MTTTGNPKGVDYISKQANLTAQIEGERQAAKKWWDEYGLCYLENAQPEEFTYDSRIQALRKKLEDPKYQNATLHTANTEYGCRPPFKEYRTKI
ncbi:hypothetical protein Plhal304r1_c072g0160861 [Plasmopara halstedii]